MPEADIAKQEAQVVENLQAYFAFVRDEECFKASVPELSNEELESLSLEELATYERQVDEHLETLSERTAEFIESLQVLAEDEE